MQVNAENESDRNPATNKDLELAVANLYGYARYFNPNKQLSNLNWDKFLMYVLRQSQYVSDNSDSIRIFLEKTFISLIPDMQLTNESKLIVNALSKHNSNKAYFYRHYGFGSQRQFAGDKFYSKIVYEKWNNQIPKIDSLYSYKILDNLYLYYPVVISKQNNTFNTELKNIIEITDTIDLRITEYSLSKVFIKKEFGYMPIMYQDKSVFKANLIERWNIMKHFYPYLKEDKFSDEKMNQLLLTYLNKIDENITDESTGINQEKRFVTYFYILKEFMANFNDGHLSENGVVQGTNKRMASQSVYENHPLIALDYVEDTIVSKFDLQGKNLISGKTDTVKRGDRLISVNDIPIDSLLSMKLKCIASSNDEAKRVRFLRDGFLTISKDSLFRFVFQSSDGNYIEFDNNIANHSWGKVLKTYIKKTDFINNLGNGIYYIDFSSDNLKEKTFKEFISTHLDSIKTLIFELREYPMPEAMNILSYLSEKPIKWGSYKIPTRYFPNQEQEEWTGDETLTPKYPNLKGILCYALININTVSYGESITNTLKKNKLATLVGTNSSGINGDMSNISQLMFGFVMTVGKDLDGYHSVGVPPDIYVKQTLDDYRKDKDTVFECVKKLLE